MPYRPNTPCKHPGCPKLVPYGTKYYDEYKAMHSDEVRSVDSSPSNAHFHKIKGAGYVEPASRNNVKRIGICVGEVTSLTPVNTGIYYNGEPLDFTEFFNVKDLIKAARE